KSRTKNRTLARFGGKYGSDLCFYAKIQASDQFNEARKRAFVPKNRPPFHEKRNLAKPSGQHKIPIGKNRKTQRFAFCPKREIDRKNFQSRTTENRSTGSKRGFSEKQRHDQKHRPGRKGRKNRSLFQTRRKRIDPQ